ncbi:YmaF family protein [Paenibacillus cisolokensis]|uniref:YmaF family protein n=1 Tax=Paenibacillus cisolokensis TaxID=1658519 RepID=UPI003D282A91
MKIPVTGFVMGSGGDDAHHSHKLYITSWNGIPVHVHAFSGETTVNDGHSHKYSIQPYIGGSGEALRPGCHYSRRPHCGIRLA